MNWLGRRNWVEAEKASTARIALNPDDERAMADLAEALRHQGRLEESVTVSKRVPSARLLLIRAKVHVERGEHDAARASLQTALELIESRPEDAASVQVVSEAAAMLGLREVALTSAQRAVVLNPSEASHLAHLGKLLLTSDPALAEQRLRQSLKLDPEQAEVQADLGAALLAQKKPDQAYEAFKAALGLAPEYNFAATQLWSLDVAKKRQSALVPFVMVSMLGSSWLAWTSVSFGREPTVDWHRMGASLALMLVGFSIGVIRDRVGPRNALTENIHAGMSEGNLGPPQAVPVLRFFGHALRGLGVVTVLGCAIGEVFVIHHYLEKRVSSDFLGMGLLSVGIGIGAMFLYEAASLMRQAGRRAANRN